MAPEPAYHWVSSAMGGGKRETPLPVPPQPDPEPPAPEPPGPEPIPGPQLACNRGPDTRS